MELQVIEDLKHENGKKKSNITMYTKENGEMFFERVIFHVNGGTLTTQTFVTSTESIWTRDENGKELAYKGHISTKDGIVFLILKESTDSEMTFCTKEEYEAFMIDHIGSRPNDRK